MLKLSRNAIACGIWGMIAGLIIGNVIGWRIGNSMTDRWHYEQISIGNGASTPLRIDRRTGETEMFFPPSSGDAGWRLMPSKKN